MIAGRRRPREDGTSLRPRWATSCSRMASPRTSPERSPWTSHRVSAHDGAEIAVPRGAVSYGSGRESPSCRPGKSAARPSKEVSATRIVMGCQPAASISPFWGTIVATSRSPVRGELNAATIKVRPATPSTSISAQLACAPSGSATRASDLLPLGTRTPCARSSPSRSTLTTRCSCQGGRGLG